MKSKYEITNVGADIYLLWTLGTLAAGVPIRTETVQSLLISAHSECGASAASHLLFRFVLLFFKKQDIWLSKGSVSFFNIGAILLKIL